MLQPQQKLTKTNHRDIHPRYSGHLDRANNFDRNFCNPSNPLRLAYKFSSGLDHCYSRRPVILRGHFSVHTACDDKGNYIIKDLVDPKFEDTNFFRDPQSKDNSGAVEVREAK